MRRLGNGAASRRVPAWSGRRDSVITSAAVGINALLNGATVVLSAHQGGTREIATYTIVTAILSLIPVAIAGGSTLLYACGDDEERAAVRSQRVFVVLPALAMGALVVGIVYTERGYTWPAILAVALAVIGNTLGDLQYADLSRQLRFTANAVAMCSGKAFAVLLVAAGAPLTTAVAVATVANFVALEVALGPGSWLRPRALRTLSAGAARRAYRQGGPLFVLNVGDLYCSRVPTVVLSFVATTTTMGCFGVVISAFDGLLAVSRSAMRVSMSVRVRRRHGLDRAAGTPVAAGPVAVTREVEVTAVGIALLAAAVLLVAASWITSSVLRLPIPEAAAWWRILAVALPFAAITRAFTMNLVGDGDYRAAARLISCVAVGLTALLAVGLPTLGAFGSTLAVLGAEVLGVVVATTAWRRRRPSPRPFNGPFERPVVHPPRGW